MPTVIDSLLVKLGLESSEFTAGKNKVDKGLKETGKTADSTGKSVAKFLSIVGGTAAIKRFVETTIESSAALDRLSQNLQLNVSTISAWSNAAEVAGGSASGLQGTMDMLSKSQTELQLTGQSGLIPYLSSLGVSMADAQGKARPVSDMLLDLSEKFGSMDRTTANNMGRMMGLDQGTMQLLLKGRSEVELMIKRQKEFGVVTKKQAEESSRMRAAMVESRQSFEAFGRELLSAATPAIEKFFSLMSDFGDWMRNNKEFVSTFLTIIAAGLAAIAAATIPINLTVAAVLGLAAAIALLYQDYQTWKRGGDSLIDWAKWEPGIKGATTGLKFLKDLLVDMLVRAVAVADAIFSLAKGDFAGAKIAAKAALFGIPGVGIQPGEASPPAPASTAPTGSPAKSGGKGASNQEQAAMAYFQAQGWSREQAAGLAANIKRESAFNAGAVGDSGKAYGIAQWHPDRQAEFQKRFGKPIQGSSFEDQMAFMHYELTQGNERAAGDKLRGASSASEAAAAVSMHYERPADRYGEAAKRGQMALSMLGGIPGASMAATGAGAGRGSVNPGNSSSVETHIGEVNVYTTSPTMSGVGEDIGKTLGQGFTAQANYGLM